MCLKLFEQVLLGDERFSYFKRQVLIVQVRVLALQLCDCTACWDNAERNRPLWAVVLRALTTYGTTEFLEVPGTFIKF